MSTEIDFMEYSSDANAQAAYVTNATNYGPNILTGGTASADTEQGENIASLACDGLLGFAHTWSSTNTPRPHYWQYDFGSGVSKAVTKVRIYPYSINNCTVKNFTLQGSNNGSSWTTVYTGLCSDSSSWQEFTFSNSTPYRYYKINVTDNYDATYPDYVCIEEVEMMELSLQSFSESTIKTQGSYALKVLAAITDSLNKTLTHTVSPTLDLSGVNTLKFDMQSTRTGANVKLGLHDTGGTTTELTPTINSADTYETKTWDLSGVADADKNAIDTLTFTQVNADSATTWYVDNFFAPLAYTRLYEETVTLSELFQRDISRPFSLETITLSEIFRKGITKNWIEQVTLTEYYQRKASLFWVFSDEITLTEVFNFYRIYFKEFLDDITLTDLGITRVFGKNFSEQITLTEIFRRAITRSFIDIVILTEVGLKSIQLVFTELVTLSENFVKGMSKRFTETVTLSEVFRRAITKTWRETITLTESFTKTSIYRKLFIDQITLTEVFRWWKSIKPKGGTWTKDSPGGGTWNKRNP